MCYFPYGATEMNYLSAADPILGAAIARYGLIQRKVIPALFPALVYAITGQQISGRAQETVWNRLTALLPMLTPEAIQQTTEEALRSCGLSGRKVSYIRTAADAFQQGRIVPAEIAQMEDEVAIDTLIGLPGVGRWTAEMLLIFSLQRPNVLSFGDFGIRKGMALLYGLETVTKSDFLFYRQRYVPYATVAGFYLWRIASEGEPATQSESPETDA